MKQIELDNISLHGFQDLIVTPSWRLSHAGYDKKANSASSAETMERHLQTDEAFLLLEGKAFLVTAGNKREPGPLSAMRMRRGKILLVEKTEWHVCIHTQGSHVLIVENGEEGASECAIIDQSMHEEILSICPSEEE